MVRTSRLLLLGALAGCAHFAGDQPASLSVAEAERAFAADAQLRTVNEAFVKAFASDGIVFRPRPVQAQQTFASQPYPANTMLRWTPTIAETAAAGDLAVTTGPADWGTRGSAPTGTGYFLSVWRHGDNGWQVVIDAGIEAPIPTTIEQASNTLSRRTLQPSPSRSDDLAQMRSDLMHSERVLSEDYPNLMREHATSDVRVYRNGHAPTANIGAAVGLVRAEGDVEWTPQAAVVSRSGDLGYTYGVARQNDEERGYLRVWRNQHGSWQVAYDLR